MRRLGVDGEILWEIKENFHHQIVFSSDKKKVLALSSEVTPFRKKKYRVDKFLVISLDGRIVSSVAVNKLIDLTKDQKNFYPLHPQQAAELGTDTELSHFNSFYEIPKIEKKNRPHFLDEGNYILNGLKHGILVVSPDLKKVLMSTTIPGSLEHSIHDVQVTPRGTYLIFNNKAGTTELPFSTVTELDPLKLSPVFEFRSAPPETFYSPVAGNVQELDRENILFTNVLTGTFIYSKTTRKITHAILQTHATDSAQTRSLRVSAHDLTEFLKARAQK